MSKEIAIEKNRNSARASSIELFRIVTMICIVAHHYVVNSGVIQEINPSNAMSFNSLFSLVFGWGGKTGINCFVLITGYFMCKSNITVKKFLKLFLEIEFYNIVIYLIFLLTGYTTFSVQELVATVFPIYGIGTGFLGSYLVFYLFIPFLNILINAMDEKTHLRLICLTLFVGSVIQTFMKAPISFTYVGWFMVLYVIAAYVRLYPKAIFDNKKVWAITMIIMLLLSWISVVGGAWMYSKTGTPFIYYHFVDDSHKILAVATAVSAFMFFKNLSIRDNVIINRIAASSFGVLMIHANSDSMRIWLWRDLLDNIGAYYSKYYVLHAIGAVIAIYVVTTLIDMIRIRCFEVPFFKWYDTIIKNNR